MSDESRNANVTGGQTEGGITSSYATNDGVTLRVRYSFFGSIYDQEERDAAWEAMQQDSLTMGPQVKAFQDEFAASHGVKHAFAVSNCTTGMHLCTQLFDLRQGDEVIITPITFFATTLALLKEKVTPVYADIDLRTGNVDPADVARKVTAKTRAIYVVHYGGQIVDMDPIMEIARRHKLLVLEDCAHAHGAEYKGRKAGSLGDVGVFSFHSLKIITTCGEGGMITTNHSDFAKPIEALRCMNLSKWDADQTEWQMGRHRLRKVFDGPYSDYWIPAHFDVEDVRGHWGNNYRMNEIQAAVGRAQLRKLDRLVALRRQHAHAITRGISGIEGVFPVWEAPECKHVYYLYTLQVDPAIYDRDEFLRTLYREHGVQGIQHYQPTYHFTGLKKLGIRGDCPNAEEFFYKRETNLPLHPRLTQAELDCMIDAIQKTARKLRR